MTEEDRDRTIEVKVEASEEAGAVEEAAENLPKRTGKKTTTTTTITATETVFVPGRGNKRGRRGCCSWWARCGQKRDQRCLYWW